MGMIPRTRRVRVVGIYALGLYEFDAACGFVSLDFAERLLGKTDARPDPAAGGRHHQRAGRSPTGWSSELGPDYVSQDWADMNQSLFSALWLEKMAMSIAIGLIVMVAALQHRRVAHPARDGEEPRHRHPQDDGDVVAAGHADLHDAGADHRRRRHGGGRVVGLALCWVLDRYRLIRIPMDVYQVAYVPFVVQPLDFAIVIVSAIVICFLATIYPSRQASRLDPVQALRFE